MPNLSQFLPMEIACGPLPRFPTNEQHLRHSCTDNSRVVDGLESSGRHQFRGNIIWTSPYSRKLNPVLDLCNLLEENKPRTTNDLRLKEEEKTVLCINRMFPYGICNCMQVLNVSVYFIFSCCLYGSELHRQQQGSLLDGLKSSNVITSEEKYLDVSAGNLNVAMFQKKI